MCWNRIPAETRYYIILNASINRSPAQGWREDIPGSRRTATGQSRRIRCIRCGASLMARRICAGVDRRDGS
jgi:hypothetical protein